MEKHKTCSFFGHRKIELTEDFKKKVRRVTEDLIVNDNVTVFLFGSRSEFDSLCHLLVTELKENYPQIKRVAYTCKSEKCVFEKDREEWEKIYSFFTKRNVELLGVEEEVEHKTKYVSGRASYIERNQAMIDDSDYCVFYYDENYKPSPRNNSNRFGDCCPKSGTAIAYNYAKRKKKTIINTMSN